jgi:chromosome segregation ATPase
MFGDAQGAFEPFGSTTPEGDGSRRQAPRLTLEAADLNQERPELNEGAQKRDRILSLISAATSGLGALANVPELAVTGASLAEGFAENRIRRQEAFMNELAAFRDRRQEVQSEQRQTRNREALANYEAQLEDFRDEREFTQALQQEEQQTEEAKERAQFNDELERARTKWERGLPLTEEERRTLEIEEKNAQTRRMRERRLQEASQEDEDDERSVDELYGTLKENSFAMSELSRQWALTREELESLSTTDTSGESDRKRDRLQSRADRLQEKIDELVTKNARIRSRIQDRESDTRQSRPSQRSNGQGGGDRRPDLSEAVDATLRKARSMDPRQADSLVLKQLEAGRISREVANRVLTRLEQEWERQ